MPGLLKWFSKSFSLETRLAACLFVLAGSAVFLSSCGGGGSGGGAANTVGVTATKNPVLVTASTAVTASFANVTSLVKFGSIVTFTATAPAMISSITTTGAGGFATATLTSTQPGTFVVSASAGNFTGSTTVMFENPASADLLVALDQPVDNLGAMNFRVTSDAAVSFNNFSSVKTANSLVLTNPALPPAAVGISQVTAALLAPSGVNINAGRTLFKFNFGIVMGIPNFTVTPVVVALTNGSPVRPVPGFSVSTRYYDVSGRVLSP